MRQGRRLSRAARSALVSAGIALVTITVVLLGVALTPDPAPTVSDARASVERSFERVIETVPAGGVLEREIDLAEQPCPLEGGGVQIAGTASVTLDGAVDRAAWLRTLLSALPEEDGWYVSATTYGTADQFRLSVVGRDLSIVEARLVRAQGDSSTLEMTSTSECVSAAAAASLRPPPTP